MFGERRSLKLILVMLAVLLTTGLASAGGRVVWKKTKIAESAESWKIDIELHMTKAPDFAHVPMKFEFEPLTYFERSLEDGNKEPQTRRVPLTNKSKLIETVDIGFMDPGTGKTQARTRFSFKLTRARGFEAGEYSVKIKDKRTDAPVGSPQRITLDGENEVIDRRSISFEPSKKKKKEAPSTEPEYDPSADPNNDAYWAGGPKEAERSEDKTLPPPAHLQENPGSCAVLPGSGLKGGSAWLLALLAMLAWTGRGVRRS